jgi:nicotinamidase-related amidase
VRRHRTVEHAATVLAAARRAGVRVVHCLMARRGDGAGARVNCLLLAAGRKSGRPPLVPGSPQQAPVAALAPADGEWVVTRFHGVTPFHGTELDQILRNQGVETVVLAGVSVNVGILGATIEAVNAGYQVVVPREAVAGTPDDYVEAVLANTLRLLATVLPVCDVEAAWPG